MSPLFYEKAWPRSQGDEGRDQEDRLEGRTLLEPARVVLITCYSIPRGDVDILTRCPTVWTTHSFTLLKISRALTLMGLLITDRLCSLIQRELFCVPCSGPADVFEAVSAQ